MKQITTSKFIKIVLLSILFSFFSSAQSVTPARTETSDISNLIGTWINVDNNTRGIKKIIISKATTPKVHVFGACSPTACDWGVQQAKAYSYFSVSAVMMEAVYKSGFSVKELNLRLTEKNQSKQLIVDTFTHLTDGSGGKHYVGKDKFKQVLQKPAPNKHTAVKSLPNKMHLTPAQLRAKRLAEWYKAHPDKNPKIKKVVPPKPQPKPQKSINQRLPKECGFGSLYYGKVKYHKGNKAYYLTVKDRFSQNDSEDFELTEFVSPKLLNRHVVLYGNQLLGGKILPDFNGAISGKVIQVVDNNLVDFNKLKVWCTKQPTSSN